MTLTGKVKGAKAGVVVTLERRVANATAFAPACTATTDGNGELHLHPAAGAELRLPRHGGDHPARDQRRHAAAVAPLVGLKVSDSTPRKGQRVRFEHGAPAARRHASGDPAQEGRRDLRRRPRSSRATPAAPTWRYSKRFRIRRTGTYRTVIAAHADHAEGVSRERTLTVG